MNITDVENALKRLKGIEESVFFKNLKKVEQSFLKENIQFSQAALEELEEFLKMLGSLETAERLLREDK